MSKLGELRGTVTVAFEGVAGEAVATFAVPIAVLDQHREGDAHAVALGTPESAIRGGITDAYAEALDLAIGSFPTVRADQVDPDPYSPRDTEPARRAIDDFLGRDAQGVGGSNP